MPTLIEDTRASGRTARPNCSGKVAHALLGACEVEERALRRLAGEDDVLRHAHDRDEHEALVHHPDPVVDRVVRRVDEDPLAVQPDLALVRVVEPVEDVHEGRLARAVLAEEGVHLALRELEVDLVVREHSGEVLRDS